MCIGFPMQVREVQPGRAVCAWQGGLRTVGTALVGPVAPGDWLLVFLDDARERLAPARAAEIAATLALLGDALQGGDAAAEVGFVLPSQASAQQLHDWAGLPAPASISRETR